MQWQGSCKKSKHRIYSLSDTAIVDPDLKVPAGFDVERLKNAGKAFLFRQKSYLTAFQPELKSCKLLFRDPGRIEDTAVIVFPVFNMTVNKRHDRTAVVEHAGSRFAVTLITLVFI